MMTKGIAIVMKVVLKYSAIFVGTFMLLFALLLGNALIPQDRIQSTMEQSAEYLNAREVHFYNMIPNFDCTKIDEYADSMLLNVAYNIDSNHPLESILWARYHHTSAANVKTDFRDAVLEDASANEQYLRYWHGSIIFERLFHMICDIRQMYILYLILLIVATTYLEVMMLRVGMRTEAIGMEFATEMIAEAGRKEKYPCH